jgi:hypothetical protein
MKKKRYGAALLVCVLTLGLAACSQPTGGGGGGGGSASVPVTKSIKITGFNLQNPEMIFVFVSKNRNPWPPVAGGRNNIVGSDIIVELNND